MACDDCSIRSVRVRRPFLRRFLCRAAFRCEACGERSYEDHRWVASLRWYVRCPRCLTTDVNKRIKFDKLDTVTRNPLRHLLRLAGASIYHCTYCRYQFPDLRKLHPRERGR